MSQSTKFVPPGEGSKFWILGDLVTMKVSAAETGGAYLLAETTCNPGGGPPPHLHHNEDEAFLVLDPDIEFLVGDKVMKTPPGSFVYGVRRVMHQFRNKGTGPARFVVRIAPAKFDEFFKQIMQPFDGSLTPPAPTQQIIDTMMSLCPKFGLEMHPDAPETGSADPEPRRKLSVFGEQVTLLVTAADSAGEVTISDITSPPGGGPPVHSQRARDVVFYVYSGRFEFTLGEKKVIGETGATVRAPRGVRHTFKNVASTPSRMFVYHTPGGFETFFEEASRLAAPLDKTTMTSLLNKHGMDL